MRLRPSRHGQWISFESDPHLRGLRDRIRYRCTPCVESLLEQLREGKGEVDLGPAYHCWKVVAVLKDEEECLQLLERYQERFLPGLPIQGRFGSREGGEAKAIVVHADSPAQRDCYLEALKTCVEDLGLQREVFYSKGCAYFFEEVLGPWQRWRPRSPILRPEKVPEVIRRIEEALRG